MIKLIIGNKGSGKTKKLIEACTAAAAASNGNVVCVEQGPALKFDLTHKVRLIDTVNYGIAGYEAYYGLLAGICAGNFDVTDIYGDATLRIGGRDFWSLGSFLKKIDFLSKETETNFVFTISCDESDIPDEVFTFAERF